MKMMIYVIRVGHLYRDVHEMRPLAWPNGKQQIYKMSNI